MKTNKIRMPLDITMTFLSIVLMGGAYLFPADIVHEILGVILQQQFFFLDLERGYVLFALDYVSIIILLATIIHYLNKLLKGKEK